MDTSIEASQSGDLLTKPSLPPKPSFAPKPFSLQKNSTIRSFKAPKIVSKTAPTAEPEASQTEKSEAESSPTTTVTSPAKKLPQSISSAETALKTDPIAEPEASQTEKLETKCPQTTAVTIPTEELSQPISSPETAPKTAPTSTSETNKIEKSETITPTTTKVTVPTEELSQPISSSATPPKTASALKSETNQIQQSEAENPTADTIPAKKLPQPTSTSAPKPQPASALPKSQPEASKISDALPQVENSLGSETAALDPATEITPVKEEPKSEPAQKDIIQTNQKLPTTAVASSEQKDGEEKQSDTPVSVSQNTEESNSNSPSTNDSFYQRGSVRKRLPKALTAKFESGGVPLPRQSFIPTPKPITKDESNKPESSDTQHVHTTPEPPIKESDTETEDFTGGHSIKKRISQLLDYVPKPEVTTKRMEPEITDGIGGVKEKIKNWASETGPEDQKVEKSPQAADRVCSQGLKPETPRVEVPQTEETPTQPVDSRSTASSSTGSQIEPPEEAPFKDKPLENATEIPTEPDKPKEDDVQVQSNNLAAADEKNLAELKKKKMKNRRSVRFGTVVADDGTPPVLLGPEPESSEDENQEENAEVESKEKGEDAVSLPVYKRVGIFQRKDDETQSQEALKHQEQKEERKRRELEEQRQKELKDEEERLKLEEAQRQKEEETRKYQQELMELMRMREEEKELEKEKLRQELEREQVRKQEEEERKRQEDEERERRELEMKMEQEEEKRKRRELEEQRQKELKDEEERLKLEETRRQKEEEESRKYQQELMEQMRMREEEKELEKEKLRQEDERKRRELERKMQQHKEEEEERKRRELEEQRQKELKDEEERLKLEEDQRQKEEEESRKYQQRLMEQMRMREKEEELEKEKLRQELEREQVRRQEEEERKRQEEIKLQMEKEKAEELKKKMEESQPRTEEQNDKREKKLINLDAVEPPASPSPHVSKNTESLMDVVYDDFSIQNPVLDVAFDDFSVKPRRRTFQPRRETAPISSSWRVEPPRKDDLLVSFDSKPQETQQENEPKPPATQLVPTPVPETPEEEKVKRLLVEFGVKEEGDEKAERPVADQPVEMKEEMENGAQMEDKDEEDDNKEPQANSYITNDEDKLIQTLLHSEQDGISEQTSGADSPTPVPDASSEDLDNTDSQREMDLDAVCENSAPLLDNSSQKSKAVLGRRLTRTRPSRSLRLGSAEAAEVQLSVFKDELDNQSNSEEEPPESKPVYSSTQRVPMFPGLNPKDLLIGIKKKTGGVAAEAEERSAEDREQETESQNNKAAPSPSQASGTPRATPRLAGAKLVLPPAVIKDGGLLRPTPRKRTTQQNGET